MRDFTEAEIKAAMLAQSCDRLEALRILRARERDNERNESFFDVEDDMGVETLTDIFKEQ